MKNVIKGIVFLVLGQFMSILDDSSFIFLATKGI